MGEKKIIIPILIFAAKSYDSGSKPWILQIQQLTTGNKPRRNVTSGYNPPKEACFFLGGGGGGYCFWCGFVGGPSQLLWDL